MITYCAALLTLNFLLLIVHTIRKERANNKILAHLERAELREQQMWDLLEVVSNRRESERVHHREAEIAKDELGKKVDAKTEELGKKIDELPPKLAEVMKTDSGTYKRPKSPPDQWSP